MRPEWASNGRRVCQAAPDKTGSPSHQPTCPVLDHPLPFILHSLPHPPRSIIATSTPDSTLPLIPIHQVPYCFKHFVQTEPSDSCVGAYVPMFSLMLLQKCNKLSVIQLLP
ncbi:unnamed protein product [Pleuronectes platessa]|uniref:Uncharacterized protein n=1 Tax=Pleuronectes platessa TaxID=8262 RepID=A0A9N7Z1A5_PLEPL|nr:unnamed protein product [Pleuronectes platessa]